MSARYRLAPQLEVYDRLANFPAPYLAFTPPPRHRSAVVNTDGWGFRHSLDASGVLTSDNWRRPGRRGLLIGGSTAFGVGCTHDGATLASRLSERTGFSILNLGLRAGNSTQEVIATFPFLTDAQLVIVLSGVNNLVVQLCSAGGFEPYGALFDEGHLAALRAVPLGEVRARLSGGLEKIGTLSLLREIGLRLARRLGWKKPIAARAPAPPDLRRAQDTALAHQTRDLHLLARALPEGCRLLFVAQPLAGSMTRPACAEEAELFAAGEREQGTLWRELFRQVDTIWPAYVEALQTACRRLGVDWLNLNSSPLPGWSFVDKVHMTDHGYDECASIIAKELADAGLAG